MLPQTGNLRELLTGPKMPVSLGNVLAGCAHAVSSVVSDSLGPFGL